MNNPIPAQITGDQARNALKALGFTAFDGVREVHIDIDKVTVKRFVRDEFGDRMIVDGGHIFQEHVIQIVEAS